MLQKKICHNSNNSIDFSLKPMLLMRFVQHWNMHLYWLKANRQKPRAIFEFDEFAESSESSAACSLKIT